MAVHTCFDTLESIISVSIQAELNVWFKYQYSHWSTFCCYLGCSLFIPSNFYRHQRAVAFIYTKISSILWIIST